MELIESFVTYSAKQFQCRTFLFLQQRLARFAETIVCAFPFADSIMAEHVAMATSSNLHITNSPHHCIPAPSHAQRRSSSDSAGSLGSMPASRGATASVRLFPDMCAIELAKTARCKNFFVAIFKMELGMYVSSAYSHRPRTSSSRTHIANLQQRGCCTCAICLPAARSPLYQCGCLVSWEGWDVRIYCKSNSLYMSST